MKRKIVVTTAAAAALAATLVISGTYAYLTDSSNAITNTFAENGNDVELDETTGSDYDIIPGTEQEKDPTITATYTLDSYVYVKVTDETKGLVEWYIANGWSELDGYENVYSMELKTIYDAETWTQVEDQESDYNGQYTYTDDNGVVYYYNTEKDEYTAIIPVLKDNKVTYSADITNDDMTVGETVDLIFQAYIMQMSGFDSAEDVYYESIVTKVTSTTIDDLQTALNSYSDVKVTMLDLDSNVDDRANNNFLDLKFKEVTVNVSSAVIDLQDNRANTRFIIESGDVTLTADYSRWYGGSNATHYGNLYLGKDSQTMFTVTGEDSELTIDGGRYIAYTRKKVTLLDATDNAVIRIKDGEFALLGSSATYSGKIFYADGGTIYVDNVSEISLQSNSSFTAQYIFTAANDGVIYVAKDIYETCAETYSYGVLGSGCSAEYDEATGYYVITAD